MTTTTTAPLAGLKTLREANPRSPLFEEEWLGEDPSAWTSRTKVDEEGGGTLLEL